MLTAPSQRKTRSASQARVAVLLLSIRSHPTRRPHHPSDQLLKLPSIDFFDLSVHTSCMRPFKRLKNFNSRSNPSSVSLSRASQLGEKLAIGRCPWRQLTIHSARPLVGCSEIASVDVIAFANQLAALGTSHQITSSVAYSPWTTGNMS